MKQETYDKLLKFNLDNSSDKCKLKAHAINKAIRKIHKNDNAYINCRDNIVNGLRLSTYNIWYIKNVSTSENGRKELYELEKEIMDIFKE